MNLQPFCLNCPWLFVIYFLLLPPTLHAENTCARAHTTNCVDGALKLLSIDPIEVCLPNQVVSFCMLWTNDPLGKVIVTTTNDPRCGMVSTNQSEFGPHAIAAWATVTGPAYTNFVTNIFSANQANCQGLWVSFLPTNFGKGDVEVFLTYSNPAPCDVIATTSIKVPYAVTMHKLTFDDTPNRPPNRVPWHWKAKLQAVCVDATNSPLAEITWQLDVDTNYHITLLSTGDGNPGDIGKIVIDSFTNHFDTNFPGAVGAGMKAHFIGCKCNNSYHNWIQTVTEDDQPINGLVAPFNDCYSNNPPFYWSDLNCTTCGLDQLAPGHYSLSP